jgi:hypothetical protein
MRPIAATTPDPAERRIPIYYMKAEEAEAFRAATSAMGLAFEHASPEDQLLIAKFMATHVRMVAPELSARIEGAMRTTPMLRVRGGPEGEEGGQLRETILALLRGKEIFQYAEQLDGQLTGSIEPRRDGAPNSNSSPEPFGFHTDDAIMPAEFRVEEISLLSIYNPAGTLTGFAFLEDIL